MEIGEEHTDDAKWEGIIDEIEQGIGFVEASRLIFERASLEDRAHIAGMALPEHGNLFEAIAAASKEFAERRADFSKPPLPKLSAKQIVAITKRANARPWTERDDDPRDPFEWVRDNYKNWVGKGLLQSHLKADETSIARLTRASLVRGYPIGSTFQTTWTRR